MVVVVCVVVVLWWCVCVVCGEAWHTLSLLFSLLPLLFPFLLLSYLYFCLFFFFFFILFLLLLLLLLLLRHLNVIWCKASAQQSVLSLLLSPPSSLLSLSSFSKKYGNFSLQEYFRRGIYF